MALFKLLTFPVAEHARTRGPDGPESSFEGLTILLLEDNPADVTLLRIQLAEAGITDSSILTAARLSEAVEIVRTQDVSLILADLGLPDAFELEAVENLQAVAPGVPIVVMTGLDDEETAVRALHAGAQDYFVKGEFDQRALKRALRYAIERERARKDIAHMAHHDALTGLPNRLSFNTRLQQLLSAQKRKERLHGLLYVDLDGFKPVNDELGHDVGDLVLLDAANRMLREVREADTVARLGGDEFAILLEDIEEAASAEAIAQRVVDALGAAFEVDGAVANIRASVGVAIAPDDGDDVHTLVKVADHAMYVAKRAGGNGYRRAPQGSRAVTPASDNLYEAVEKSEFELHVQPQWSAMGNRVRSAEVFLRWRAKDGRLLTPAQFMDRLERSTLSLGVGEWVLREAARYLLGWHEIGLDAKVRVCVNVSKRELESAGFIDRAVGMFCEEGLGPESLTLDVREDLLAHMDDRSRSALRRFRAQGGWVTIDDFGAGRCPLSALAEAPADAVKIDAGVVTWASPRSDGGFAEGLVDLCRRVGLTAIAHRVETEEQKHALVAAGFDRLQGNYFAEPALFRADELPWWGGQEAAVV